MHVIDFEMWIPPKKVYIKSVYIKVFRNRKFKVFCGLLLCAFVFCILICNYGPVKTQRASEIIAFVVFLIFLFVFGTLRAFANRHYEAMADATKAIKVGINSDGIKWEYPGECYFFKWFKIKEIYETEGHFIICHSKGSFTIFKKHIEKKLIEKIKAALYESPVQKKLFL